MQTEYSVQHIFGGDKNDDSPYTHVIDHLSIVFVVYAQLYVA